MTSYYDSFAEENINLKTLESFPELPKPGLVTVCEVNGELQVTRSEDPEHAANSAAFTNLTDQYVPVFGENFKAVQNRRIPLIKTTGSNESFLIPPDEAGLKAVWNGWYVNVYLVLLYVRLGDCKL